MFNHQVLAKTMLSAILGASLLAGTAIPAHADRDDNCRRNIQKAEQNLDKAVRKHGERSRQAERRRQQLEQARERCHMSGDRDRDRDHR